MTGPVHAAIEAGGTKFVCALGDAQGQLLQRLRIPTRDPASTLADVCRWLETASLGYGPLLGIGVASFGPVELDLHAPNYGQLLRTPKPGWSGTNLLAPLRRFEVPLALDTDVNGAALAESQLHDGAGAGLSHLAYVTVGTGIGVGVVVEGRPLHGLLHPELGHLRPRRHRLDGFEGVCPYHRDCFEGLASGSAMAVRRSSPGQLQPEAVLDEIQADYIGQLCASIVLALAPLRIVIGGGVMHQSRLFAPIRARMQHWLGGYIELPQLGQDLDQYVVPPGLGADSGILGALLLARGASDGTDC